MLTLGYAITWLIALVGIILIVSIAPFLEFVTKAVQALAELKESDAKQALIETAEFVGRRTI